MSSCSSLRDRGAARAAPASLLGTVFFARVNLQVCAAGWEHAAKSCSIVEAGRGVHRYPWLSHGLIPSVGVTPGDAVTSHLVRPTHHQRDAISKTSASSARLAASAPTSLKSSKIPLWSRPTPRQSGQSWCAAVPSPPAGPCRGHIHPCPALRAPSPALGNTGHPLRRIIWGLLEDRRLITDTEVHHYPETAAGLWGSDFCKRSF